ncbi:MAG: ABC transporter permease, partial [Bdellovibrionaceae bacterium]|nr:ABC transporter permease [Pseudobdellovibrionaceae bacterium]
MSSTTQTLGVPSITSKEKLALESALPMWKIVFRQFKEHKMAYFSTWVILIILAIALGADFISSSLGIDPNKQNVSARYLPPFSRAEATSDTKESAVELYINQFPDEAAKLAMDLRAQNIFVVNQDLANDHKEALYELAQKETKEIKNLLSGLKDTPYHEYLKTIEGFSTYHLFGTDEVGRDISMRLIYGARVSIGVGIMVAISSALIGLLIGSIAGYYGGKIDMFLMRITDALLSLPTIPILIVFSAVDLQKLPGIKELLNPSYESIIKMFVIMCLFSWMTVARLVRGSILTLREREFVLAAKTLGATDRTIILRHMFPNVIAPMLVAITLGVGSSIIYESALSFLGLGIMPPTPSWGNMLNN